MRFSRCGLLGALAFALSLFSCSSAESTVLFSDHFDGITWDGRTDDVSLITSESVGDWEYIWPSGQTDGRHGEIGAGYRHGSTGGGFAFFLENSGGVTQESFLFGNDSSVSEPHIFLGYWLRLNDLEWGTGGRTLKLGRIYSGEKSVIPGIKDGPHDGQPGKLNIFYDLSYKPYPGQCYEIADTDWHAYVWEFKIVTPGQPDGVIRLWVDGELEYEDTAVNWNDTGTGFSYQFFPGMQGNLSAGYNGGNMRIDWDDFIYATTGEDVTDFLGITAATDVCGILLEGEHSSLAINTDPAVGEICGNYRIGETDVCGCEIDPAVGSPFLPALEAHKQAAFQVTYRYSQYEGDTDLVRGWGFWPDFSGGLRDFCSEMDPAGYTADVHHLVDLEYYDETSRPAGVRWIYPDWTLDAAYALVGNSQVTESPAKTFLGIYKPQEGADLGWRLRNVVSGWTNVLTTWGGETSGTTRTIFGPSSGYHKLTWNLEPRVAQTGETIVTLDTVELLGKKPTNGNFADSSTVSLYDGGWAPAYLTAMYNEHLVTGPTQILVTDLQDCKGSMGWSDLFLCKTALLFEYDWATYPFGLPTNPALSEDGKLVSFHRDGAEYWWIIPVNSPLHVLKNPFEWGLLASCDQTGSKDGYQEPIDCTGLLQTTGSYDWTGKCPGYACCDEPGITCDYCVTLGAYETECGPETEPNTGRNDVVFYEQEGEQYAAIVELAWPAQGADHHVAVWKLELDGGDLFTDWPGYPARIQFVDKPPDPAPYGTALKAIDIQRLALEDHLDKDRDGVADASDNCPCHFNPAQGSVCTESHQGAVQGVGMVGVGR